MRSTSTFYLKRNVRCSLGQQQRSCRCLSKLLRKTIGLCGFWKGYFRWGLGGSLAVDFFWQSLVEKKHQLLPQNFSHPVWIASLASSVTSLGGGISSYLAEKLLPGLGVLVGIVSCLALGSLAEEVKQSFFSVSYEEKKFYYIPTEATHVMT